MAKQLQLPELQPHGRMAPHLEYDQFTASLDRLQEEQSHRLHANGLWLRLSVVDANYYSSAASHDRTERLLGKGRRNPEAGKGNGYSDISLDAEGLYTVLNGIHTIIAGYSRERSAVGVLLPQSMDYMPRNMGVTALVASTYAMNDHLSRGK